MREGSLQAPVRNKVDWQKAEFYDEEKLDTELRRVFDICHGCRRCFNLCDSFPRLFDLIDSTASGEMHDVKSDDFKPIVDACTMCDMCFMTKCPYVPPHEFALDFPHLMLRYRAVESKKGHNSFVDKALTNTDRNGEFAKHIAPLANWATKTDNSLSRNILAKIAGIDPKADLPVFASQTFVAQSHNHDIPLNEAAPAFGKRKAVLYATCSINFNDPELGHITRRVLAHNGIATEVQYPACCGMPQLELGNLESVTHKARVVSSALSPWIDQGYDIVALVPSCALMLKLEWPLLFNETDPDCILIKKLAAATYDLSEYIVDTATKFGLTGGMTPQANPIALHIACHARAQNMGTKSSEMLKLIPGAEEKITVLERCSGHGGSWGIKKDNFQTALKIGKPVALKASELLNTAAKNNQQGIIASECPLAAAHISQGIENLKPSNSGHHINSVNPIEILAKSYGIERG